MSVQTVFNRCLARLVWVSSVKKNRIKIKRQENTLLQLFASYEQLSQHFPKHGLYQLQTLALEIHLNAWSKQLSFAVSYGILFSINVSFQICKCILMHCASKVYKSLCNPPELLIQHWFYPSTGKKYIKAMGQAVKLSRHRR